VSGDTTANKKPHPEPILHACAILGVPPAANLHIGDSDNDLLAARAAGCRAFAVPYGYTEEGPVDTANCDALVSDLLEAARRVAEINQQATSPS
jgi:phosphoglycolate phosphatase